MQRLFIVPMLALAVMIASGIATLLAYFHPATTSALGTAERCEAGEKQNPHQIRFISCGGFL